jgi:hypothetical protein
MASTFFCHCLLQHLGTELRGGAHLLQAPVLVLQLLELGHQRRIHAAELAAPLVECRRADAVLAAQLRYGCAGFSLLEHGQDLAVGESGFFHGTSSGKTTRKFHFWRQLTCGGITDPLCPYLFLRVGKFTNPPHIELIIFVIQLDESLAAHARNSAGQHLVRVFM